MRVRNKNKVSLQCKSTDLLISEVHKHAVTYLDIHKGTHQAAAWLEWIQCVEYSKWFLADRLSQQQRSPTWTFRHKFVLQRFKVIDQALNKSVIPLTGKATLLFYSFLLKLHLFPFLHRLMCIQRWKKQDVKWTLFIVLLFLWATVTKWSLHSGRLEKRRRKQKRLFTSDLWIWAPPSKLLHHLN